MHRESEIIFFCVIFQRKEKMQTLKIKKTHTHTHASNVLFFPSLQFNSVIICVLCCVFNSITSFTFNIVIWLWLRSSSIMCLHRDKMPPSNCDSALCEMFRRRNETVDSNNSVNDIKAGQFGCFPFFAIFFNFLCIPICISMQNKPDGRRSIWLLAIEIAVKFLQYSNGSPRMCAIALLSKLMAFNVGVSDGFRALHKTLDFKKFEC